MLIVFTLLQLAAIVFTLLQLAATYRPALAASLPSPSRRPPSRHRPAVRRRRRRRSSPLNKHVHVCCGVGMGLID